MSVYRNRKTCSTKFSSESDNDSRKDFKRFRKNALAIAVSAVVSMPPIAVFADLPISCTGSYCNSNKTFESHGLPQGWRIDGQTGVGSISIEEFADRREMEIEQLSQSLLIEWDSFDIAPQNRVVFSQPNSEAVAVNRIFETSPSEIFGSLEANGQVFLFNRAGIIFGPDSQVNVGTLVASSLELPDSNANGFVDTDDYRELVSNGLLSYFQNTDASGNQIAALINQEALYPTATEDRAVNLEQVLPDELKLLEDQLLGLPPIEERSSEQIILAENIQTQIDDYLASRDPSAYLRLDESLPHVQGNNGAFETGTVWVQPGANVESNDFGRIMLFGSEVTNAGFISTPNGQAIIAASEDQVWIEPVGSDFVINLSEGGTATNWGEVVAERGSIDMIGMAVNQNGIVRATTSINFNGDIELRAEEAISVKESSVLADPAEVVLGARGSVTFGNGSQTRVDLEISDNPAIAETAVAAQPHNSSRIDVVGVEVLFEEGSQLLAPNGTIDVFANLANVNELIDDSTEPREFVEGETVPSITIEENVIFDVSGTNTTLDAEDLVVEVTLTGTELADFPIQKNEDTSDLRGLTLAFDIRDTERFIDENGLTRYLLPFADVTGTVQSIDQRLEQRASNGGTVNLNAGLGNLHISENVSVDLSAGYTEYRPGFIVTSQLIDEFGAIVSIGDADASVSYQGVLGSFQREVEKWATTQVWQVSWATTGIFDPGFIDYTGAQAGDLNLVGSREISGLENLNLLTEQIASPTTRRSADFGATLRIGASQGIPDPTTGAPLFFEGINADENGNPEKLLGAPEIIIFDEQSLTQDNALEAVLEDDRNSPVPIFITTDFILDNNIANLDLASNDQISISENTNLTLPAGGKLHLTAPAINLSGDIHVPGGEVTARVEIADQSLAITARETGFSNHIFIDSASIDVSGLFTNDFSDTFALPSSDLIVDGGSINLIVSRDVPGADLIVSGESVLDVSAGAWIDKQAQLIGGRGGAVTISLPDIAGSEANPLIEPQLLVTEDASIQISGFGYQQGGIFTAQLPSLNLSEGTGSDIAFISNAESEAPETNESDDLDSDPNTDGELILSLGDSIGARQASLSLQSEFFSQNGFADFDLTSTLSNVVIESGNTIQIQQQNYFANAEDFISLSSGSEINPDIVLRNDFLREAANLDITLDNQLNEQGLVFFLEEDARLQLDPGARFSVVNNAARSAGATSGIFIDGDIVANSGEILLSTAGVNRRVSVFNADNGLIWLGGNANVDVSGVVIDNPNPAGVPSISVLPGGTVDLDAGGFLVLEEGARLDASGTSGEITVLGLDALPGESETDVSRDLTSGVIGSDAGEIKLSGAEGAIIQGDLIAHSGNDTTHGGLLTFTIEGERMQRDSEAGGAFFDENSRAQQIILSDVDFSIDFENPSDPLIQEVDQNIDLIDDSDVNGVAQENDSSSDTVDTAQDDATDLNLFSIADSNEFLTGLGLLSRERVVQGGFTRLALNSSGTTERDEARSVNFVIVDDSLNQSLDLSFAESISISTDVINVNVDTNIDAPYISLTGNNNILPSELSVGESRLTFSSVFESSENRDAGLIDISRLNVSGIDELILETSGDIRFTGNGGINSLGTVIFDSRQVYAITNSLDANGDGGIRTQINVAGFDRIESDFETEEIPGRILVVANNNNDALPPLLSGVNSLEFNADEIFIDGVVRAPFGNIDLNANSSVNIGSNAVLSVSAQNQVLLYDTIRTGTTRAVAPESSGIDIESADIRVAEGAVIDLTGGGDLLNWAFIPGPSGSADILDPEISPNSFAIIAEQDIAPLNDPNIILNTDIGRRVTLTESVELSNGEVLEAGTYAVLPARYALLENAWFVTQESDFTDLAPNSNIQLLDKTPVVAGFFNTANTAVRDQRYSGFSIRPGFQSQATGVGVNDLSDYQFQSFQQEQLELTLAESNSTIWRPENASSLQLSTQDRLSFEGSILGEGAQGQFSGSGAQVGISAQNLRITTARSDLGDGFVELIDSELNSLNVSSLLLGGRRDVDPRGEIISAQAETLIVDDDVNLIGDEIFLTSKNQLVIGEAELRSDALSSGQAPLILSGSTALAGVSNRNITELIREGDASLDFDVPQIQVSDNALLSSANLLILDAIADVQLLAASIEANQVRLGASKISLGDAPENETGLVIPTDNLPNFLVAEELVLRSSQNIDLFGDLEIVGETLSLSLDSTGLRNLGGGSTRIDVAGLSINNSSNNIDTSLSDQVNGNFSVIAETMSIRENRFSLLGWENFSADIGNLILEGKNGSLDLTSTNTAEFSTDKISALAGSNNTIFANGIRFSSNDADVEDETSLLGLGSRFNVFAETIEFDVPIRLASGVVSLEARSGDLIIGDNAILDVSGISQEFFTLNRDTWGGRVNLVSQGGDVDVRPGSIINVAGAGEQIAGELSIRAELLQNISIGSLVSENGSVILPDGSDQDLGKNIRDVQIGTRVIVPQGSYQLGENYYQLIDGSIVAINGEPIPQGAIELDPSTIFVPGNYVIPEQAFRSADGTEIFQLSNGDFVQVTNGQRILLPDFAVSDSDIGLVPSKVFIPSDASELGIGSLVFADGRQQNVTGLELIPSSREITETMSFFVQPATGTVLFDNGDAVLMIENMEQSIDLAAIQDANGVQTSLLQIGEFTPGGTALENTALVFDNNQEMVTLALEGGNVQLDGGLIGSIESNVTSASIFVDTSSVIDANGNDSFNLLNTRLNDAGFSNTRQFRLRQNDLTIETDSIIRAENIRLALENGDLRIAGIIDASGNEGGSIDLSASGNLTLESSARILAEGIQEQGGDITLSSYQPFSYDEFGLPTISGLVINEGVEINANGVDGGGRIRFRALRNDPNVSLGIDGNNDLNLSVLNADGESRQISNQLVNAESTTFEGVRRYIEQGTSLGQFISSFTQTVDESLGELQLDVSGTIAGGTGSRAVPILPLSEEEISQCSLQGLSCQEFFRPNELTGTLESLGVFLVNDEGLPFTEVDGRTLVANVIDNSRDESFCSSNPVLCGEIFVQVDQIFSGEISNFVNYVVEARSFDAIGDGQAESAISERLGLADLENVHVAPGVEVLVENDFIFASILREDSVDNDLDDLVELGGPGNFSLNSSADLTVSQQMDTLISSEESWSLNFSAGSAISSAPWVLGSNPSDLTITHSSQIVSGTGDIDFYSSDNINLLGQIFSVGRETGEIRGDAETIDENGNSRLIPESANILESGGNVSLTALGSISGSVNRGGVVPFFTNGVTYIEGEQVDTSSDLVQDLIFVDLTESEFNIDSIAGGDVSISAGSNINELSTRLFTSLIVEEQEPGFKSIVERLGAGNLDINTHGDFNSNFIGAGDGNLHVRVDGSLGANFTHPGSRDVPAYSMFGLQGGTISINAGDDIATAGVVNPSLPYALSYDVTSKFDLSSLSGDISFNTEGLSESNFNNINFSDPSNRDDSLSINQWLPGVVNATAFDGSVFTEDMFLSPSPIGQLNLLAQDDIVLRSESIIALGENDPNRIPVSSRFRQGRLEALNIQQRRINNYDTRLVLPSQLIHAESAPVSNIVALTGDYTFSGGKKITTNLFVPTELLLFAGNDIFSPNISIKHANSEAVSQIIAGGIIQDVSIDISGPGRLDISAGEGITINSEPAGESPSGLSSVGSLGGPGLSDIRLAGLGGADLNVYVGVLPNEITWQSFIQPYLDTQENLDVFVADLRDYVDQISQSLQDEEVEDVENLSDYDVLQRFLEFPEDIQNSFISSSFSGELGLSQVLKGLAYSIEVSSQISSSNSAGRLAQVFLDPESPQNEIRELLLIDSIRLFRDPNFYVDYYQTLGISEPETLSIADIQQRLLDTGFDLAERESQFNFFGEFSPVSQQQIVERSFLLLTESEQRQIAFETYNQLAFEQQQELILDSFFGQLRDSGRLSNQIGSRGYIKGYEAITELLPETSFEFVGENDRDEDIFALDSNYSGDLTMELRRIYTLDGGDINLVIPGGLVNAGDPSVTSPANAQETGVVAAQAGDIRTYTQDDFLVNQSRVQTLGGGSILMWSSVGDLDAGRGARTALSVPAPVEILDPQTGAISLDFGASIVGSGIRQSEVASVQQELEIDPNGVKPNPGIDLIAPNGAVDAGEAGIFAEGNLSIAANEVINAQFIEVGGDSQGVPAEPSISADLAGASDIGAAASAAAEDAASADLAQDNPLSWIEVSILGFGSVEEDASSDSESAAPTEDLPKDVDSVKEESQEEESQEPEQKFKKTEDCDTLEENCAQDKNKSEGDTSSQDENLALVR